MKSMLQILQCLHAAMQAVRLHDPLLRVSVGLRLALHLEGTRDWAAACQVIKEVSPCSHTMLCLLLHNMVDYVSL